MAKIIKVGSQNITPNKIANPFRTSRNSTTNPFLNNNFEGTTLPFELAADVFAGAKTEKTNRLRMIATSVTGSMSKVKSLIPESVVNFVKRVHGGMVNAWKYANETSFSAAMADAGNAINTVISGTGNAIKENKIIRQAHDLLNTEIHMPTLDIPSLNISSHITALKESAMHRIESMNEMRREMVAKGLNLIPAISFHGKAKYSEMSVAELETHLIAALADGGINE